MAEIVKKTAFKITRAGQLVGTTVTSAWAFPLASGPSGPNARNRRLGCATFLEMGLEHLRRPWNHRGAGQLNDTRLRGGIMASTSVGG